MMKVNENVLKKFEIMRVLAYVPPERLDEKA